MSYMWQVIEDEMERLRDRNEELRAQLDALRADRDAFADDVARLHKASGFDGPTRGRLAI